MCATDPIYIGSGSPPVQNSSVFSSFHPDEGHVAHKTSEGQKNATSKHYLSPSYPPLSLSSKLHSQTHLPCTPKILANGRQGAIGMVPEAPPTNT